MKRTFVMCKVFDTQWRSLGLGDDELRLLQSELLVDPDAGDRMQGTAGVRKYRFGLEGRGKRGGARICYLDIPSAGRSYLLAVYAKNEKDNISMQERHDLKQLALALKATTQGGSK